MSTIGVQRQMKTENLVHAKRMIERTLEGWDLLTWNELLADDIVLSLKLGTLDTSRMGGLHGIGSDLEVNGQREAKSVLKRISGDLRKDLFVTTEVVGGYDGILLGNLALRKMDQDVDLLPVGIYMALNAQAKIQKMTIAVVDLQALTDAIKRAAQTGVASNS